MSQFVEVLAKIADGGTIAVLDGKVRVEAPPGLLTDLDKEVLTRHKSDILSMLTGADADTIAPHSGKTAIVSTPAGEHKPTWPIPGSGEVLALTPNDLPATPWTVGSLSCFDNGKVLNDLRIDLSIIGYGGANQRSGRLRHDVAAVLVAARRVRA